jgi:spermidine synthase
MIPRILLDTAPIPGSDKELRLYQHAHDYSIDISGEGELMSSRVHGSEVALAELACSRIDKLARPRVLIGGLGMGFTLAAALKHLGADAELVVAELVPKVIEWNRGPLGDEAGKPLLDKRVRVKEGDVAKILKTERNTFNAIILDVDNGPNGLTHHANDWLYSVPGLSASYQALKPRGVLAIWSAGPDVRFTRRLRQTGFRVEEILVHAHGKKGAKCLIWIAER